MNRIIGFDLGTNSIGTAIRNTYLGDELTEQMEYYSVDTFDSGVGNRKNQEYSYAAERSSGGRQRRLYDVRRRRRWETLKYLIPDYCPLSPDDLTAWTTYDKGKGLNRHFPVENKEFMQWIRMDFDGDGISDCTPYELRYQLVHRQFDFDDPIERYRFGRAIFHICQHRGFRSSKGETLAEQVSTENADLASEMKLSEIKKSGKLKAYMDMKEHQCKTAGEALYLLNKDGYRIRNSEYQVVRSMLKDEVKEIFTYQNGLSLDSDLYLHLTSEKKGEGCIFYKNPLRSQKRLVGKCTLEPSKRRAPISHPEYEKYRAFCFIANIRIRKHANDEWEPLQKETKQEIYKKCFTSKVGSDFEFKRIRKELERLTSTAFTYEPNKKGTINYKDEQSVPGCPIISRFVQLFGDEWENVVIEGAKERNSQSKTASNRHAVTYSAEDIWHVCFTADEQEDVEHFGYKSLRWDDDKVSKLVKLWGSVKQGYGMLSLKAIRNINRMLGFGLDLSDAIFLAKIPELVGIETWENNDDGVQGIIGKYLSEIKGELYHSRTICKIVNTLISNYKSLPVQYSFAYKDTSYKLQDSDLQDIDNVIVDVVGEKTWGEMSYEEQESIINEVRTKYQEFFASTNRDYCKARRLADYLAEFLTAKVEGFDSDKLSKLYHPSMTEFPSVNHGNVDRSDWKLGSPKLGGIRNPVALRALHVLRRKVNSLLEAHMIDPETTRVVIETTRDKLTDANMRWAIAQYQKKREEENRAIEELLKEFFPEGKISDRDYDKANSFIMQKKKKDSDEIDDDYAYEENVLFPFTGEKEKVEKDRKSLIRKYRLWKEQGGICLYTGRVINFSSLFNTDSEFDIEHTLPRSKSFDDSQANLTICDLHYNRAGKGNKLPVDLPNYSKDAEINGVNYTAILPRLQAWEKRVEKLQDNVNFWKRQTRKAQDKKRKDDCIRQRHLWQMELNYWRDKLSRFKMKEIPQGFRHRQLADTGIISRYAVLYLKTVFRHVEVQKGQVTDVFKKIIKLQSSEGKKDRGKHSHHAVDAMTLTLIPVAAKLERMLKLYYEKEETSNGSDEYKRLERELDVEIQDCHLGKSFKNIIDIINSNILISHQSKYKYLIPSSKKVRRGGKVVMLKNEDGTLYPMTSKGDSIRGSLHGDTYYGAIQVWEKDADGNYITDENGHRKLSDIRYVVRRNGGILEFKETNVKDIVDEALRKAIEQNIKDAGSFKEAKRRGFYMIVKGKKINVRHIRCYDSIKNPLIVREHVYQSMAAPKYKHFTYAANDSVILYSLYRADNGKAIYRTLSLMEAAEISRNEGVKKPQALLPTQIVQREKLAKKKEYTDVIYYKSFSIIPGQMVMLKKDDESITDLTHEEKTRRLYKINRIFDPKQGLLQLQYHLEARDDKQLVEAYPADGQKGKNGFSEIDFDNPKPRLLLSPLKQNFWIEGVDFEIISGEIVSKH